MPTHKQQNHSRPVPFSLTIAVRKETSNLLMQLNALRPLTDPASLTSITMLIGILASSIHAQAQTEDGLFAVFSTSGGNFTCELYYKRAPRTVANFVSLAEGTRPWMDFQRAKVSNAPFYDNTTFHRVVKGFVIQGGSPNGTGTDGPGYRFRDELHSELKHDRAGILSMAKTAQPHTAGSQFFVTLAATPWLDNVHSVFGAVIEGQSIVDTIGQSITDPADRPQNPQIIHSIRIVRNGTEAQAFKVHDVTPPLPVVRPVQTAITRNETGLDLVWDAKEEHDYHAFFSEDLETWGYQTLAPAGSVSLSNFLREFPAQFYLFVEAETD